MRVLVTGSEGLVGSEVQAVLTANGHEVLGYDLRHGQDILDMATLTTASGGCDAVIHLAVSENEVSESEEMHINLLGTWNVLLAAEAAHVSRVIYVSSVDALGIFQGEGLPVYLPIDDAYPTIPHTAYAIAKRLAEEMCQFWSDRTGIPVLCLRPPGIWTALTYLEIQQERAERPSYEWEPYWEYGAFIDVRDLATAVLHALTCELAGYSLHLIASSDITTSGKTSRELVQFVHPNVEWRSNQDYQAEPFRSLLVTQPVQQLLGWRPEYTWQRFIEQTIPPSAT
ncbi:MAG: NAD(P)-dependent oxidoreductase [Chloroflexota bacterium]